MDLPVHKRRECPPLPGKTSLIIIVVHVLPKFSKNVFFPMTRHKCNVINGLNLKNIYL